VATTTDAIRAVFAGRGAQSPYPQALRTTTGIAHAIGLETPGCGGAAEITSRLARSRNCSRFVVRIGLSLRSEYINSATNLSFC